MHDTSIDCDFTSELLRVGFQLILPSKYIIDVDQIIRARGEGVNIPLRGVILLLVGLLAKLTHLSWSDQYHSKGNISIGQRT